MELDVATIGAILYNGVVSGAVYGFSGWMVLGHDEPFDGPKFLRAILVGIAVGIFAGFAGVPLAQADADLHSQLQALGVLAGLSGLLDQFVIWLFKRLTGIKPWRGGPDLATVVEKGASH